jgi:hypothetical protein
MHRLAQVLMLICATAAGAETGWLTAKGRVHEETLFQVWGGTRSIGAGMLRPDTFGSKAGVAGEVAYAFFDRAVELRGTRVWQFSENRFATGSFSLGGTAHVVTGRFNVGLGPQAGLHLSLGGKVFSVDLGLLTGAEFFFNSFLARLPQRGAVGINVRVGHLAIGANARIGADIVPGQGFVGRGELVLTVGWFGFDRRRPR